MNFCLAITETWMTGNRKLFHEYLKAALDKHAPYKSDRGNSKTSLQWFNSEITRSQLRKMERKWRLQRTVEARAIYTTTRSSYHQLLTKTKMEFISKQLQENSCDPRRYWRILNSAMHRKSETPLPSSNSNSELAEQFNTFFLEKIMTIKRKLTTPSQSTYPSSSIPTENLSNLNDFQLLTEKGVHNIINRSPKSSNSNDPMPPWLLWKCIPQLLPSVTHIVNWSLLHGMSPIYKEAILTPLLKNRL
jgi:hypothetical protein